MNDPQYSFAPPGTIGFRGEAVPYTKERVLQIVKQLDGEIEAGRAKLGLSRDDWKQYVYEATKKAYGLQ